MKPLLRCRGLVKRFDRVPALHAVDLDVAEGDIHALLGPSGCGKTTLLRLLCGLEVPDAGTIEIAGQMVGGPDLHVAPEKRPVGMVFQDGALFPHLSVRRNVAFGLRGQSAEAVRRRVEELLALTDLRGYGERMPDQLSGGQRQRVAIARALAPADPVLLLDEPFSSLDARLRGDMSQEVRRILRAVGATAVLVTHDRREALSIADTVSVMLDGQIAQTGTPRTVYGRPSEPSVARVVGEVNLLPGQADGRTATCALGSVDLLEAHQGPVQLLIRPEQFRIDGDEGVAVEIRSSVDLGDRATLRGTTADGTELQMACAPCDVTGELPSGSVVASVRAAIWAWPA